MRINLHPDRIARLAFRPELADRLGEVADDIAADVVGSVPSHLEVDSRSGVGPQGAYGQAMTRGRAAVAIEFGSVNNPPGGQLRAALHRKR